MWSLRTLDGIDVAGKRVVVRADLNVPIKGDEVADDTRIRSALPTIKELLLKGARVIVLSHFGRPDGQVVSKYSLARVGMRLEACAGMPVRFVATDWRGGYPVESSSTETPDEITLMENTRFHPGEEANDPEFSKILSSLGDIFVNDAFSVSHRAHSSTEGIARLLPSFAGRSMEAELKALDGALGQPVRPVAAIIGGAKISTKLAVLENLVASVDLLFVGGGMANTFLHVFGRPVGRSICEPQLASIAARIILKAREHGCSLILPKDVIIANELVAGAKNQVVGVDHVPLESMILDIGPATVASLEEKLASVKTVVWNGPVGAFEVDPFQEGTFALAQAVAALTKRGSLQSSVAGGGDTLAALAGAGVIDDFSYASTAGGAFLEWLEGRELPGVAVLRGSAAETIASSTS